MQGIVRASWVLGLLLSACGGRDATGGDSSSPAQGASAKPTAASSTADDGEDRSDELLTLDTIHDLHLELDEGAMASLAVEERKYVIGAFRHGDTRLENVAIRFKGHRTMRDWRGKPSFKVHFAREEKGRRYMGLGQIMLHNGVEDPTMLREALGNYVVRKLGVPTPRTGFARVFVNGELFGLYVISEPADKAFLARHFGDPRGPLYEGAYGCDVYPDDVLEMEHERGDDPGRQHIRALAKAAQGGIDDWLHPERGPMDREAFLRFLAVDTLVADFDGYRHGHNYLLYFEPSEARWYMLPWGLDRVLRSKMPAFDHHGLLSSKCLSDARCRLDYVKALHAAMDAFDRMPLHDMMRKLDGLIAQARDESPRERPEDKYIRKQLNKTSGFLRQRTTDLREQLTCWNGSEEVDADGDGYGCLDCDDGNAGAHPGAKEVCGDGVDNDCSGHADDAPECPCEDVELDNVRFSLCHREVSWARAAATCEARGQHLARVDSKEQARALHDAAEKLDDDTHWWIGLTDAAAEGKQGWHDGSGLDFEHWAAGEPDDHACGQDCVALKEGAGGRWRDLHCGDHMPFICRDSKDLGPQ